MPASNLPSVGTAESRERWGRVWIEADNRSPFMVEGRRQMAPAPRRPLLDRILRRSA